MLMQVMLLLAILPRNSEEAIEDHLAKSLLKKYIVMIVAKYIIILMQCIYDNNCNTHDYKII